MGKGFTRWLRPRETFVLAAAATIFVFVGVGIGFGGVGNNSLIELDGNAFVDSVSPKGLDWSCIFGTTVTGIPDTNCASSPTPTSQAFKNDPNAAAGNSATDDSIGGGSADIEDISQWHGVIQSVPAKDDLEHAGWAAYEDPTTHHLITYFVADRYSNNGSAFLGFWLFKGNVSKNADGSYNGHHIDGDVLVLVDNAGNVVNAPSEVGVFEWDSGCTKNAAAGNTGLPCSGDVNLATLLPIGNADCAVSGTGDVCASFNTKGGDSAPAVTLPSAWPFQASRNGAAANTYDTSEFVEGAIDLTSILNGQDCFTSVQAETRSSNSLTAELKDTVLARLTTCGTINVVKDAQPNSSQSFGFSATGLTPTSFNLVDDGTPTNTQSYLDVKPTTDGGGPYAVSETPASGWTLDSATCSNGSPVTAITVARGETVTCTFVNKPTPAHLTLVKVVDNTNGGTKGLADFPLTATGPTTITGVSGAAAVTNATVPAGAYALSEQTQSGYTASNWSCSGGTQNGANITLAPGGAATCTITNTSQLAHLTLVKVVDNANGGTKAVADFPLTATGPQTITGVSGTQAVTAAAVKAGTYALSEQTQTGYAASTWSCQGGNLNGSDVTLAPGGSATCTITNTAKPAHLTLVKVVDNTNGGTKTLSDFPLTATGPQTVTGVSGTQAVTGVAVKAGSYVLTEQQQAGYTASAWQCTGGSLIGSTVTLALDESATCTITNVAKPAHLTLIKVVDNTAGGGTKTVSDFPLTATGPQTVTGVSGTQAVTGVSVKAGVYALSEQTQSGYSASAWQCTGGSLTGSSLTLGLDESATCTITNTALPAHLTLVKVVNNTHGGQKGIADFPLTATGPTTITGISAAAAVTNATVKAGVYTLSEVQQYGYQASAWQCTAGSLSGSTLTLGNDVSATCTITNNDLPGTIVIKKVSKPVNSGSFAFTTTGSGYNSFTIPGGGQNSQSLNAGTYTVTESTQLSWILTGIGGGNTGPYDCAVTGSGGSTGVGDLNTQSATITLKNGDTVTCTFENTNDNANVTRTQGFWATHTPLANIAWFGGSAFGHTFPGVAGLGGIGDTLICTRDINTLGKLMGGFWSDISKTTTGGKRSALDQVRMQLLQQLLAAELNASAFGSVPSGGVGMFAAWESAYCGTNQNAIKNAQQQAASFNTAGDSGQFTPGTSADSKNARAISDQAFWNVLP